MTTDAATGLSLDRRFAGARSVADAVCYEGYVLYPYRASAAKNQFRWQWGVLVPPAARATTGERDRATVQFVIEGRPEALLQVRARGLHVQARSLFDPDGRSAARLDDGDRSWTSFDEAVEWQEDLVDIAVGTVPTTWCRSCQLVGDVHVEGLPGGGRLERRRHPIDAWIEVRTTPLPGPMDLVRVEITVANRSVVEEPLSRRHEAVRHALVAAHLLVAVDGGHAISSLEPAGRAADAVKGCTNDGLFPVLVGAPGVEVVLASPITLYDHPAVAPESPGDMFDATEIDEILALRVRTLTDDEKREARGTDQRSAAVVDRCDAMDEATLDALHGTMRTMDAAGVGGSGDPAALPWWTPEVDAAFDPWTDTVDIGRFTVAAGTRVVLRPSRAADAQDLFVAGRSATVAGVFHDVSGDVQLAVSVDDPDADLSAWHGRYLYFGTDEVEVMEADDRTSAEPSSPPTDTGVRRILVAGVGNIFLGDDGFGVEVVRRLPPGTLPPSVNVADFGIRGVHLAYELIEGYEILILVDAVRRGDPPGTLTLLEHVPDADGGTLAAMDAHGMDPAAVLAMAGDLGARVGRVLVLAGEAQSTDEGIGLSAPMEAAVAVAGRALVELVASLLATDDVMSSPLPTLSLEESSS